MEQKYKIFLSGIPGMELQLLQEAQELDLRNPLIIRGGVVCKGTFGDIMRANLMLRCASRVLVRVAEFKGTKPSFGKLPWDSFLRMSEPVRISILDRRLPRTAEWLLPASEVEEVLAKLGYSIGDGGLHVEVLIREGKTRVSVDTSGQSLEVRGPKNKHKSKQSSRPIVYASMFRAFGYSGSEPLIAPVDQVGNLIMEAAEIETRTPRQHDRHYDFEKMLGFDPKKWSDTKLQNLKIFRHPNIIGFHLETECPEPAVSNIEGAGFSEFVKFVNKSPTEIYPPESSGLLILPEQFFFNSEEVAKLKTQYRGWRVGRIIRGYYSSAIMVPGLHFEKFATSHSSKSGMIRLLISKPL